jgi:uncharacterized membrane protein YagU involved in acid resistance
MTKQASTRPTALHPEKKIWHPCSTTKPLLLSGFLTGIAATLPMTVYMLTIRQLASIQKPLPPLEISRNVAGKIGLEPHLTQQNLFKLSSFFHLLYGGLAGTFFIPTTRRMPVSPLTRGSLYGLLVWADSYLGWLPITRTYPPPTQNTVQMNILIVTSHLVWGAILGSLITRMYTLVRQWPPAIFTSDFTR